MAEGPQKPSANVRMFACLQPVGTGLCRLTQQLHAAHRYARARFCRTAQCSTFPRSFSLSFPFRAAACVRKRRPPCAFFRGDWYAQGKYAQRTPLMNAVVPACAISRFERLPVFRKKCCGHYTTLTSPRGVVGVFGRQFVITKALLGCEAEAEPFVPDPPPTSVRTEGARGRRRDRRGAS